MRAVAERSALSREEAADLVRATLDTLGSRLSAREAKNLAARLPESLRDSLHIQEKGEHFGLHDFVRKVSKRTGLTMREATAGVRAVLTTLREAVDDEAFAHAMSQLPGEFQEMAEATA
ncbi:DUF2267 domain-containing protein [Streptosporangium fragile]|uniref:DUF2267 domain-containing protein n=1 Tax=Streptosporangium fragile TaxID=46186 RepID=UPI0031E936BE